MDCRTGEVFKGTEEMISKLVESGRKLVPITESMYQSYSAMNVRQRKNNMRNRPCVCGSGSKFKKCCWSKYR